MTAQIETVATVHPFEPPLLEGTTLDSARVYEIAAVLRRRPLLVTAPCIAHLPSSALAGDRTRFCNAYHLFKEFFPDDIARELAENIQPWVTVVGFEKLDGDNLFSFFVR